MTALYIIAGCLAFFAVLLIAPIHLKIRYNDDGLLVRVRYLVIPLTLFPFKEKKPKKPRKSKKIKPAKKERAPKSKHGGLGKRLGQMFKDDGITGILSLLSEMAKIAAAASRKMMASVVIDRLDVAIIAASDNAADTAVQYGRICAALYPAVAAVESFIRVRRRNIIVSPDFLREDGAAAIDIAVHVRVWRLVWVGIYAGVRFIFGFLAKSNTKNTTIKKGVQKNG